MTILLRQVVKVFRRPKPAVSAAGPIVYVAEDGVTVYVAEDGVTPYVTEDSPT